MIFKHSAPSKPPIFRSNFGPNFCRFPGPPPGPTLGCHMFIFLLKRRLGDPLGINMATMGTHFREKYCKTLLPGAPQYRSCESLSLEWPPEALLDIILIDFGWISACFADVPGTILSNFGFRFRIIFPSFLKSNSYRLFSLFSESAHTDSQCFLLPPLDAGSPSKASCFRFPVNQHTQTLSVFF